MISSVQRYYENAAIMISNEPEIGELIAEYQDKMGFPVDVDDESYTFSEVRDFCIPILIQYPNLKESPEMLAVFASTVIFNEAILDGTKFRIKTQFGTDNLFEYYSVLSLEIKVLDELTDEDAKELKKRINTIIKENNLKSRNLKSSYNSAKSDVELIKKCCDDSKAKLAYKDNIRSYLDNFKKITGTESKWKEVLGRK